MREVEVGPSLGPAVRVPDRDGQAGTVAGMPVTALAGRVQPLGRILVEPADNLSPDLLGGRQPRFGHQSGHRGPFDRIRSRAPSVLCAMVGSPRRSTQSAACTPHIEGDGWSF